MAMTKIDYGAPKWNEPISNSLEELYAGGYDDSYWRACTTLVNGAHAYNIDGKAATAEQDARAVRRRIIDFHKFKLVLISGEITVEDFRNLTKIVVVKLPAGYPIDFGMAFGLAAPASTYKQNSSFVRWQLNPNGTELTYIGANITEKLADTVNFWLPINIWYLSK